MTNPCDAVAERVAFGESLEPFASHVASCAACQHLVEMPRRIGAARQAVDPGLGFSARMTAGAQHRIAVRRRRRMVAGLAATMAAGALGVVVFTRQPDAPTTALSQPETQTQEPSPERNLPAVPLDDAELNALVNLADTPRTMQLSANWKGIEQPLVPYRRLVRRVKGGTP